jgi:hypothetical protein
MDNKTLIIGAVLLGAFYLSSGGQKEQRYMVPGVGYVPESQLPSYGYVNVGGKWYSQAQVDAAAAAAGVSAGNVTPGSIAWNAIKAILAGSIPLIDTLVGGGTSGGGNMDGGTSGGGGGGMAGVYGRSYRRTGRGIYGINDCGNAGYWTRLGSGQHAAQLANCRWHGHI